MEPARRGAVSPEFGHHGRVALRAHHSRWQPADVDVATLWANCGGQWLTGGPPRVPVEAVRHLIGIVRHLDARGAGLAQSFAAEGLGVIGERAALIGLQPSSTVSCGGATRLIETADGWICVALARDGDLDLLPAWLGIDAHPGESWGPVARALGVLPSEEAVARGAELGLACAVLGEARGRHDAVLVEQLGDVPPIDVRGLVVVNLGALWAGPLCGDLLARLGATVVKVESTGRPDGSRAQPAFFDAVHERQQMVALDFTTADGIEVLAALLGAADVVIEGSRPRALAQLGIDAASVVATGRPRIWVSITGHGRAEPFGSRIGFGDDAAVAGGLTGGPPAAPTFLADAFADPLAGVTAAATVVDLLADGGRWLVDAALSRVAASMVDRSASAIAATMPAKPPRGRSDPLLCDSSTLGRDTVRVLAELGIRR